MGYLSSELPLVTHTTVFFLILKIINISLFFKDKRSFLYVYSNLNDTFVFIYILISLKNCAIMAEQANSKDYDLIGHFL